ncbi:F-box protein CPR1-like [Silene latifolia]|uniref:F-box protein CPR1-like n=1 Tax=Silene latifolia TaxID=37657 RepID=UPI003D786C27
MALHQIPIQDLIIDILVWLPVTSLLRFKSVCKEWCNLINDPRFIQLHLHKSLKPNSRHNRALFYTRSLCIVDDLYHPLKLTKLRWPNHTVKPSEHLYCVGSCNGLFCFLVTHSKRSRNVRQGIEVSCFLICNPSTRTFKSILPQKNTTRCGNVLGFGYDSQHNDYKIVSTSSRVYGDLRIYSLKADSWRCVTASANSSASKENWTLQQDAKFANNLLYYLVSTVESPPSNKRSRDNKQEYRVARFDLSSEKWMDDLSLPVQVKSTNTVKFGVLDGRVYMRLGNCTNPYLSSDIWIHGVEDDSWSKIFHLPEELCLHSPIALSKVGPPRLLLGRLCEDAIWYDPQADNRVPFQPKPSPHFYEPQLCIASLVQIPGCSLAKMQQIDE